MSLKTNLKPKYLTIFVIILLLVIFSSLSLIASSKESATSDEMAHIPAGISYVQTGDLRMNPEHPVLVKYLSGLSANFVTNPQIDTDSISWQKAEQWSFGQGVMYLSPGAEADHILFWARFPILLLSILLGLIIYLWAKMMFGPFTALVALGLYCLDPNMIAFSHLVTFDLPMAAFTTASVFCLWLAETKKKNYLYCLAGVFLGLALTSKISAFALAGLIPIILLPATLKADFDIKTKVKHYAKKIVVIYLFAIAVVWFVYLIVQGFDAFRSPGILPHSFYNSLWLGIRQYAYASPMYILGHLSDHGQFWYLPLTFLIKTPLVILLLLTLGAYWSIRRGRLFLGHKRHFLVWPVIFSGLAAVISAYTIGLRFIFITFPFLFILAGYFAQQLFTVMPKFKKLTLIAFVFYYSLSLVLTYPNFLTYSNELFGGSNNTYKHLADSNVDWGQGLIELKNFAAGNGISDLKLVYFGRGLPQYYGFSVIFRGYVASSEKRKPDLDSATGWLAVSVSLANYIGLNETGYKIKNIEPYTLVGGSILVYNLPS